MRFTEIHFAKGGEAISLPPLQLYDAQISDDGTSITAQCWVVHDEVSGLLKVLEPASTTEEATFYRTSEHLQVKAPLLVYGQFCLDARNPLTLEVVHYEPSAATSAKEKKR